MKHIAIIWGHPAGTQTTFCSAIARAYQHGAAEAGHKVSLIDIGRLDVPFFTKAADHADIGLTETLQEAQNLLKVADHWVIIYPLWIGTMLAKLKAFFEWVLAPGFAFNEANQKNPCSKKLLKGKTASVILTMGMPSWFYKWFYGAHSLKSLERNVLKFCGISPVRKTLFGFVEAVSNEKRGRWLADIKQMGASGD